MRRILVTNDDGIDSAGLHALARALVPLGEVIVFAPSREYSGAGAGIGHIGGGIAEVHQLQRPELEGVAAAYAFDGPPALAALLAIQGLFGAVPSVVVSGINPGWNVGRAVHFSGTIGAALTAEQLGIPGVAVSQRTGGLQQWATAADVAAALVAELDGEPISLNVNVPNLARHELAGTRHTTLSDRIPYQLHRARLEPVDDHDDGVRHLVRFEMDGPYDNSIGTDTEAVEAGYVSITRLRPTTHW
ncbi:MAG: 5'/3'-nucleotidase SurE [Acidimicrobiales bacterium]